VKVLKINCLQYLRRFEATIDRSLEGSKTKHPSSQGVKGQWELNRLAWSIDYEKKGVQSVRERQRERGLSRSYEA
jgi:hypothetical protein